MLKDVNFKEDNESLFTEMNKELGEDRQITFASEITEFGRT
jgi:hypothetical protein